MESKKPMFLVDYLKILVKQRVFILRNIFLIAMVAVVISLMLPQKFKSTATILPPSPEQDAMFGLMSSYLSTGLGALSGMSSVMPGVATPSDLYAAILGSGRIRGSLINKFDLRTEFKVRTMHDASKALEEITDIEVSPEGIISVTITYTNKYLAADMANTYIEELNRFNTETSMTVGKRYRLFIEKRLKETEDTLNIVEERLQAFQEKHKTISLDTEIQSVIETIAKLKSEIILREVQKGAMLSGSNLNNPYVSSLEKELRELKRQLTNIEQGKPDSKGSEFGIGFSVPLADLPEIALKFARLLREVKVQEAIYELLIQQYEQAKIMELKDTPTVQILDVASPAEKRSWPKRGIIVLLSSLVAFIISAFLVFIIESDRFKKMPVDQKESWKYIITTLKRDIHILKKRIKK